MHISQKENATLICFEKNPSKYGQTSNHARIKSTAQNISLFHVSRVVNDPVKVCNIFNDYILNTASDIGKGHPSRHDKNIDDILCSYKDHSIIRHISLFMWVYTVKPLI